MFPPKQILLPVDFGGPSEDAAVEIALSLAKSTDAEIVVVHAYELPPLSYAPGAFIPVLGETQAAMEEASSTAVKTVLDRLRPRYARVRGIVRQDLPWRAICEIADEVHADLIVIGTHGRTGLPHALLGSVAEKVVRMSRVPVLTVHGPS